MELNSNVETATTGDAFACVASGVWTNEDFNEWMANKCHEYFLEGMADGKVEGMHAMCMQDR